MKAKKLVLSSALVSSMILGGLALAQTSLAAEYPDATHANSTGTVRFKEGDGGIVDPEDPEKPVDPENPTNPNTGDLMITYVSDFDFGEHVNSLKALTAYAKPDKAFDIDAEGNKVGEAREVPSFVATKDVRATGKGWALSVTSSSFKTAKDVELKGATVTLKGLVYNGATNPNKPTPTSGNVVLNAGEKKEVSRAIRTTENNVGIGNYSLAMGAIENQKVNGVELNIPENSLKNSETYTATFNWELQADPTI